MISHLFSEDIPLLANGEQLEEIIVITRNKINIMSRIFFESIKHINHWYLHTRININ